MSGWTIFIIAIVVAIVIFVVGFFVGGKNKVSVMKKAGLIKETAGTVVDTITDAAKKL